MNRGEVLIWFLHRHKCLSWTVEWISATAEKTIRNALETYPICEAYDRAFPLPRQDRPSTEVKKETEASQEEPSTEEKPMTTEVPDAPAPTTTTTDTQPTNPPNQESTQQPTAETEEQNPTLPITPHRNLYFYLHRPRTATKKPVLVPLPPLAKLASVLRGRTVLEFPSIYALPDSPETILAAKESSPFILEEEYLCTATPEELGEIGEATESEQEGTTNDVSGVDLGHVDERKVLEVLKQDLFESGS